MPEYLLVGDFKSGLDTRRSILTTEAGALLTFNNAHITRGKEIEKRKKFSPFASLPAGQTFGLHAASGNIYVFGSVANPVIPAGLTYQRLQSPAGATMVGLIYSENFNGKVYAIAQYDDSSIYHFYNGVRITAWDAIFSAVTSMSGVASFFATAIGGELEFDATSTSNVLTVSSHTPGVSFAITGDVVNGGTIDDQSITITQTLPNVIGVTEVLATGSFQITGGTSGGSNTISSIKVNSIEILSSAVSWTGSNANTASLVATQINSFASSPEYTAAAAGDVVRISAVTGTGSGPNGFAVAVTNNGTVTVANLLPMSGGVSAVAAQSQTYTATFNGTFEAKDQYILSLSVADTGYNNSFIVSGSTSNAGRVAKTFKTKVYVPTRSLLHFSGINDPTEFDTTNGAGYINMANQDGGAQDITALGTYQGLLAIFTTNTVQIWSMDPDPSKNAQLQTLTNIGTFAPKGVVNFGDIDVFFPSYSGIRSLKARDASNQATVSDVGTNIDTLVISDMAGLSDTVKNAACGLIDPIDGRYWLAMGSKIYVYTSFVSSQISAWSTYEPGFNISHMTYNNDRIYVRSGDSVYLYGGTNNDEYDDSVVEIVFPYLSAGKPAHTKQFVAFDMTADGIWEVYGGCDISNLPAIDLLATVNGSTWNNPSMPAQGLGTHIGIKLINNTTGYARIGNFAIHYNLNDAG